MNDIALLTIVISLMALIIAAGAGFMFGHSIGHRAGTESLATKQIAETNIALLEVNRQKLRLESAERNGFLDTIRDDPAVIRHDEDDPADTRPEPRSTGSIPMPATIDRSAFGRGGGFVDSGVNLPTASM